MNSGLRLHIFVFALLLCGYLAHAVIRQRSPIPAYRNFLWGDATGVYLTIRSLVEDGDFDLKNQLGADPLQASDQVSIGKSGEWYPVHELLLPLAALPFYLLFGVGGLWVANVIFLALSVALLYDEARRESGEGAAFCAVLLAGLNPLVLHNSFDCSNDVFGALLLVLSFYLLCRGRALGAGLVCGLIFLSRPPLALSLPAFAVLLAFGGERGKRVSGALRFALGLLPGIVLFLAVNLLLWGSPFEVSYDHQAYGTATGMVVVTQRGSFTRPLASGLWEVLFAAESGVARGAPLLFLAAALGFANLWRNVFAVALFILVFLAEMCVQYAIYHDHSLVPPHYRHLLVAILLLALPAAAAIGSLVRARR